MKPADLPQPKGRLYPRFTRRSTVSAQFESLAEALEFVLWALAHTKIEEPTIAVTPIVTSNSEGRHVRFDVAVKGQIGPVSDHLPYESQEPW